MNSIRVRKAVSADADQLLVWRNDHRIRKTFSNSDPVTQTEHKRWFRSTVLAGRSLCFIGEAEIEGCFTPFGYCRFDSISDNELSVSIAIDPSYQSRGLARAL